MKYANTDSLDYDERLFEELDSFGGEELRRFFNLFHERTGELKLAADANFSQEELRKIIAADLQSEARELLDRYQRLRNETVRISDATQYLSEATDLSGKDLEVGSLAELLVVLYETQYVDQLDELIAGIDLRRHKLNRSYCLDTRFDPKLISEHIETFFERWTGSQSSPVPVRIEVEAELDKSVVLHLYREKRSGEKIYPVFAFRQDEDSEPDEFPTNPEIERVHLRKLDELRVELRVEDATTVITMNDSTSGWKNILNLLFAVTLGVEDGIAKMDRYRTKEAEEIEDDLEDSMKEQLSPDDTPLDAAREILKNRRSDALSEVDNLDLPPKQRDELKNCIQTINIGGSDIQDDQSIATQEFRLVGDLPQLFSSVNIEEGYRDLLNKSNPDSRGLVIQVNGKGMRLKNGRWKKLDAGGLATVERQAIEQVFEETR